jgi:hypothetical protein
VSGFDREICHEMPIVWGLLLSGAARTIEIRHMFDDRAIGFFDP